MNLTTRALSAVELLLIAPAVLFMTSLLVRNVQPIRFEPARSAERVVMWYSARPHLALWVLLVALPLAVFVTGAATLLHGLKANVELRSAARRTFAAVRAHLATLLIAAATLTAGAVLAIVALHSLAD